METKQPYEIYSWASMIPTLKAKGGNLRAWCTMHGFAYKTAYGLATGLRPPCDLGPASIAIAEKAVEEELIHFARPSKRLK
jgi:hypothetical protein